jgi:peptidoglycan/xylan/chitin deacetylase (PgdA/CDA1 family)
LGSARVLGLLAIATTVALACLLGWPYARASWGAPSDPEKDPQELLAGVAPDNAARVEAFWARTQEEDYKSPEELQAQDARELRKGRVYAKLMHGNPETKAVALTFDDGPHPQYTPQLLAVLGKYKVKATFFVVGKMVEQYPDLVRAEDAAGHQVGNHTYHHVNLTHIPVDEIALEWEACNGAVAAVLNKQMRYCRPPGGDYDRDVILAAMDNGLTTVLWTDDPGDYANPGDKKIDERVLDRMGNGGIVLLHDGVQQTLDVLPQIIESLQKRGFAFQTVEEMDGGRNRPTSGPVSDASAAAPRS